MGVTLGVARGTPLRDVLFAYGVEFPCGGMGDCLACRVKVLKGNIPADNEQQRNLSPKLLDEGWRLACCAMAEADIVLELAQWEARILVDDTRFDFTPRAGLGVAVDLGTTTIAAQLLDFQTGNVLAVETAFNAQAKFGSDVMSRINMAALQGKGIELRHHIRVQIGDMIDALLRSAGAEAGRVNDVVIVGNTAMHHLFCGIDPEPLSHYPFTPQDPGEKRFAAADLGWNALASAAVRFVECVGGFVGSDLLGGARACRLHESDDLVGLIDLGTNGEIILGNRNRLVCCSTAAGPAFEASNISMGMRAVSGAITRVRVENGTYVCGVAGGGTPRGICGSGIVDAVAAALDLHALAPGGKIAGNQQQIMLAEPVVVSQRDIRQIQLAKAAVAAGIRILLDALGASHEDLTKVYLAGAFGNYVNRVSAHRIGLLPVPPARVHPAGNTALLGAKMFLFDTDMPDESPLVHHIQHIPLSAHPRFRDVFVEEMEFPEG